MQATLFLVLIIAVMVAVFAVQNASRVDLRFLGWTFQQISLVMVIVCSFTVGILAAFLLSLPRHIRLTIKNRELTILNRQLTEEMERLRSEHKKQNEPRG
ncbi:MAG: LapA family protein [Firmicutes bacterium]|nr:LapA family protein [Bacillota bacterium]